MAQHGGICVVSSCGGHLTEVMSLISAYEREPHFYVLNDKALLSDEMQSRTYFIAHSERDWKFFLNLYESWKILKRERPKVILSTGAGPAVPVSLVGRWFFGCRIIFLETITRVEKPSMTGRMMYWIAHDFFYQWKSLAPYFPKGIYGGLVL